MKELEYFMKTEKMKRMNKYLFYIALLAFLLFSQSSFAKGGGRNAKKEAKIVKKQLKRNQLKGESEYLFDFRGEYFDLISVSEESKDAFNEVAETYQEKGINVVLIISKPYLTGLETREELDEKHKAYVLNISSRLPKNTLAIVMTSELESAKKEIINVYFTTGENVKLEDIPAEALEKFEVLENFQKTVEELTVIFQGVLIVPVGWHMQQYNAHPVTLNPYTGEYLASPIETLFSLWKEFYSYYVTEETFYEKNNYPEVAYTKDDFTDRGFLVPDIKADTYYLYKPVGNVILGPYIGGTRSRVQLILPLGETPYGAWIIDQRINIIRQNGYKDFMTMKPDVRPTRVAWTEDGTDWYDKQSLEGQVERFEDYLYERVFDAITDSGHEKLRKVLLLNYTHLVTEVLINYSEPGVYRSSYRQLMRKLLTDDEYPFIFLYAIMPKQEREEVLRIWSKPGGGLDDLLYCYFVSKSESELLDILGNYPALSGAYLKVAFENAKFDIDCSKF